MASTEDRPARDYGTLMKQALIELDALQRQLDELRRARTEPIAVVAMACRFPGGAHDLDSFWALLREGVNTVAEVPRGRWDLETYYDPDPDVPGKVYCRRAALLDQSVVEQFDPAFFGIAPREAERMDPQQRILLEVCWEALENAGVPADSVTGSRTGLFVGSCTDDYLQLFNNVADPERIDGYSSLGTARCITVGRVAYLLGVAGPVVQLDTACSSSLVAVHQACQSLRSGDSDMILAGGVNLQLSPAWSIGLCKLKALSPDGCCRAFDAGANGFVRGEGCGMIVLKRLSDALEHGDRVLAVIRGTAVNHDGRSSGLTVPNPAAQEQLLRRALDAAGLQPDDVDYIEAHGTGTALGDPIEMAALGAVFGGRDRPLWVGSLKTNIGHLEGAAGIAGLIKTVLALQHRELPPHLHFREPNPH
ncbi:MAG: polyketide synthase, partial [Planctomycetes bacterium]|nr:polyketide synthase [Planctomycetota bacterium]